MPAPYPLWWSMVERCAGREGDLTAIRWYKVPGDVIMIGGQQYHGYWSSSGNRIALAEGKLLSGRLVRHEMLHALVAGATHAREFFGESCAGIVNCDRECALEVGPSPTVPSDAAEVSFVDLELTSVTEPDTVFREQYGGWFALTVELRNPSSSPLWVPLARLNDEHLAAALFGYEIDGWITEYLSTFDARLGLGALEARRFTFDLNVNHEEMLWLADGEHTLRAFFNSETVESRPLFVVP